MVAGVETGGRVDSNSIFAEARAVSGLDDCAFYHVMDVSGFGLTTGEWDLRETFTEYLGRYDLAGTRVLEIGPRAGS